MALVDRKDALTKNCLGGHPARSWIAALVDRRDGSTKSYLGSHFARGWIAPSKDPTD